MEAARMSTYVHQKIVSVGVAGVGGWGKNLARNYGQIRGAHLKYLCDLDAGQTRGSAVSISG